MKHLKYVLVTLCLFVPSAEGGETPITKNSIAQINDRFERIERINHLLGYQMEVTHWSHRSPGAQTVMDTVAGMVHSAEDQKELVTMVRATITEWGTKKIKTLKTELLSLGVEP